MSSPAARIDPLSISSLHLTACFNGNHIGTATGFVVQHQDRSFLITNRHVCTGLDPETGETFFASSAPPDSLTVAHNAGSKLGTWLEITYRLLDDQKSPLWLEHPAGGDVDVVALRIDPRTDIQFYPIDLGLADTDLIPEPGMTVFIIGFPFGRSSTGRLAIWKTGHIASDPEIDYDGKPALLIDATTRKGMSGSPVVVTSYGGYRTRKGHLVGGTFKQTLLLGIYSGRLHKDLEIGIVWKPRVIREIVSGIASADVRPEDAAIDLPPISIVTVP